MYKKFLLFFCCVFIFNSVNFYENVYADTTVSNNYLFASEIVLAGTAAGAATSAAGAGGGIAISTYVYSILAAIATACGISVAEAGYSLQNSTDFYTSCLLEFDDVQLANLGVEKKVVNDVLCFDYAEPPVIVGPAPVYDDAGLVLGGIYENEDGTLSFVPDSLKNNKTDDTSSDDTDSDNNNSDDNNNDNNNYGKRISAGVLASAEFFSSLGNDFYSMLHSDDISVSKSHFNYISIDDIDLAYTNLCSSVFGCDFPENLVSYSNMITNDSSCSNYACIQSYLATISSDDASFDDYSCIVTQVNYDSCDFSDCTNAKYKYIHSYDVDGKKQPLNLFSTTVQNNKFYNSIFNNNSYSLFNKTTTPVQQCFNSIVLKNNVSSGDLPSDEISFYDVPFRVNFADNNIYDNFNLLNDKVNVASNDKGTSILPVRNLVLDDDDNLVLEDVALNDFVQINSDNIVGVEDNGSVDTGIKDNDINSDVENDNIFNFLKNTFSDFWNNLKNCITNATRFLLNPLSSISTICNNFYNYFKDVFPSSFSTFLYNFQNALTYLPTNIANSVAYLFTNLSDNICNGIKILLVPDLSDLTSLKDLILKKFNFIYQLKDLYNTFIDYSFGDTCPVFSFKIPAFLHAGEQEVLLVDFSLFASARKFIRNLIILLAWLRFSINVLNYIPTLLGYNSRLTYHNNAEQADFSGTIYH